jgi:KUP system potassium uptake protein
VLPISVLILLALFLVQYRGTAKMGAIFGPICAAWFAVIGLLGLWEVLHNPGVLAAISPHWAISFCLHYRLMAFIAFGSVVLAVTGAEALYADMGHFGRGPLRLSWFAFVMPCLLINYFGQAAMILGLDDAQAAVAMENPFFNLAPESLRLPLVILAVPSAAQVRDLSSTLQIGASAPIFCLTMRKGDPTICSITGGSLICK